MELKAASYNFLHANALKNQYTCPYFYTEFSSHLTMGVYLQTTNIYNSIMIVIVLQRAFLSFS